MVPADALLLAGTCIVEEAVLTGESTPQWKNPIGASADARASDEGLDIAEVMRCVDAEPCCSLHRPFQAHVHSIIGCWDWIDMLDNCLFCILRS